MFGLIRILFIAWPYLMWLRRHRNHPFVRQFLNRAR